MAARERFAPQRLRCTKYIASERNYFEQFVAEPFEQLGLQNGVVTRIVLF